MSYQTTLGDILGGWIGYQLEMHVDREFDLRLEEMIDHYEGEQNFMAEAERRGITGGWSNPIFHPLECHDWDRLLPDALNYLITDLRGDVDQELEELGHDQTFSSAVQITLEEPHLNTFDRAFRMGLSVSHVTIKINESKVRNLCHVLGVDYASTADETLRNIFTRNWDRASMDLLFADYINNGHMNDHEKETALTSWYFDISDELN